MPTPVSARDIHRPAILQAPVGAVIASFMRGASCYVASVTRLACVVLVAALLLSASFPLAASASEPAVKERNARALARYDFTHIEGENSPFRFNPPPTTQVEAPEEDIDSGVFLGFLTLPVAHSVGVRVFGGPTVSKRHPDALEDTKNAGLELGGDIFWRDPEVGEAGIGPRYIWTESEQGSRDRTEHVGGVEAYGKLFLEDFGIGPVDLDLSGRYLGGETERGGLFLRQQDYSVGGGAMVYLSDYLAVGLGGSWSRSNFGNGDNLYFSAADIDIDVLVPLAKPVTLGADVSIGQYESDLVDFSNYGRGFFSIGFSVTISFSDAKSLLELNRYYY